MKRKLNILIIGMCVICMLWSSVSTLVQAFKCPDMTLTNLFLRTPYSMVFDWIECDK